GVVHGGEVWRGTQRVPGLPKPHHRLSRVIGTYLTRGEVRATTGERFGASRTTLARTIRECHAGMKVERREGETVEQLLRRFNKGVVAERITKTYREKMHFVSKSEQRKEKRRRAERNRRKKAMQLH